MKNTSETTIQLSTTENDMVLDMLRERKMRITPQRKCILDVILHSDCNSVKDIYFEASKRDKTIGIATVYRLVRTLEELGVLKSSTIDVNHDCVNCQKQDTLLFMDDVLGVKILDMPKWVEHLRKELKRNGLLDNEKLSIVVRKSCKGVRECKDENPHCIDTKENGGKS